MLILAGITISFLFGENGIINKASNAKEQQTIAKLKERIDLIVMDYNADKAITPSKVKLDDLWEKLIKEGIIYNKEDGVDGPYEGDMYILITTEGYEVEIYINDKERASIGNITKNGAVRISKVEITSSLSGSNKAKIHIDMITRNATTDDKVVVSYRVTETENYGNEQEKTASNSLDFDIEGLDVGTAYDILIEVYAKDAKPEEEPKAKKERIGIVAGKSVESVTITNKPESTYKLTIGRNIQLNATVEPSDATVKTVTWSCSPTGIVSVDENTGLVTGISAGTATIEAKANDGSEQIDSCTITVAPTVVTLNESSITIELNGSFQLVATVTPNDVIDDKVIWSITSEPEGIAEIDQTGKITTNSTTGTATVTAKTNDGNSEPVTCEVTITDESNWEYLSEVAAAISRRATSDSNVNTTGESVITNESTNAKGVLLDGVTTYDLNVGDIFKLKYDGTVKEVRIVGFNHDTLTSSTENYKGAYAERTGIVYAGITFDFVNFMIDRGPLMVVDGTKACNSWSSDNNKHRIFLNTTNGVGKLSIQKYLKEVPKKCNNNSNSSINITNCYLWEFSRSEVFGSSSPYDEGAQYSWYKKALEDYNNNPSGTHPLIKKKTDGSNQHWDLRTRDSGSMIYWGLVNNNGKYGTNAGGNGMSPGFCL